MSGDPDFTKRFTKFILQRKEKLQENLTNLLFHTSEERLARILLTTADIRPGGHGASFCSDAVAALTAMSDHYDMRLLMSARQCRCSALT